MSRSLYYSIAIHILVLSLFFFGMPVIRSDVINEYAIVTDIVPISDLTNVNVKKKPAKDIEPKQDISHEKKKEIHEKIEKKENIEDKKESAEKVPIKKKEIDVKKEEKKEKISKKTTDNVKKNENKKDTAEDFAKSILKNIDKKEEAQDKEKVDFKDIDKLLNGDTNKEFNNNIPMSISEIDGIKSQIIRNWNTSSFSGSASDGMQVVILVELDMNAEVIKVSAKRENNTSKYYTPFVESAIRAVRISSPIQNLSKQKYSAWKEIELRFDSSGMIY